MVPLNSPESDLMLLATGFVVTLLLEYLVLLISRRLRLFAVPNERSFHTDPIPSTGGVALAVPVVGYLGVLVGSGFTPALGLLLAVLLLAGVGLWDDIKPLSALLRLVCHILAVAIVLYYFDLDVSLPVLLVFGFALVWQLNLFNFLDGIDGIAGLQVLLFCVAAQVLAGGIPGWLGGLCWLLGGASLGFLAFNWPPARIFMGDVGSGFLGLLLGCIAIGLDNAGTLPLAGSFILLAAFWVDASYTLLVRMITGQAFLQAHRSHLYQKLTKVRGHQWTTVAFGVYSCVWLVPLAFVSVRYPGFFLLWLALASAPLLVAAWRCQAGLPDTP